MIEIVNRFFKKYFPDTYRALALIVVGATVFAAGSVGPDHIAFLKSEHSILLINIFQVTGIISFIIPLFIFLLELFVRIFPLRLALTILSFAMLIVDLVTGIISYLFKSIMKAILREVIHEIIDEERVGINKLNTLSDSLGKDRYYEEPLDLSLRHNFRIEPSSDSMNWRLGFQFSENRGFVPTRFAKKHPLLHLSKESSERKLKIYYYDGQPKCKIKTDEILSRYDNEAILIKFRPLKGRKKIQVKILDENNHYLFSQMFNIKEHRFARLSAWGDNDKYSISILV
jgi:hypothetical protein